jgi:NAD(P)H-hydrate epimerase
MRRLTREQVRSIDRLAVERYGIASIVLMENASRAAADVAGEMPGGRAGPVLILCGGGNNGGDGLAIARHLHNRGCAVTIGLLVDPAKYQGDALTNWNIVRAMKLTAKPYQRDQLAGASLIVDAIFGTGLDKPPREPFESVAAEINGSGVPVLAVDVPSGLDCQTGTPPGACIVATRTITFVAEKVGFANPNAAQWLGRVTVGDIGCPRELVDDVSST